MACYESTFIVRQDVSTQGVTEIVGQCIAAVEKFGGVVVKQEYWGLRQLAYAIKRNRRGHYVMLGIKSSVPALVRKLEEMYNLNENIIRRLTVKVESIDPEPSIMMCTQSDMETGA